MVLAVVLCRKTNMVVEEGNQLKCAGGGGGGG